MKSTTVPPTTKVKRSRAGNVDTPRLVARQAYLVASELPRIIRDGGNASRNDYANRVGELVAIEDTLDIRGVDYTRHTMPKAQRLRYVVDVTTGACFPIGPPPAHYSDAGKF